MFTQFFLNEVDDIIVLSPTSSLTYQDIKIYTTYTLNISVSDPGPFHFGHPNLVGKKSAKIMGNFHKITRISYIFLKILNF